MNNFCLKTEELRYLYPWIQVKWCLKWRTQVLTMGKRTSVKSLLFYRLSGFLDNNCSPNSSKFRIEFQNQLRLHIFCHLQSLQKHIRHNLYTRNQILGTKHKKLRIEIYNLANCWHDLSIRWGRFSPSKDPKCSKFTSKHPTSMVLIKIVNAFFSLLHFTPKMSMNTCQVNDQTLVK